LFRLEKAADGHFYGYFFDSGIEELSEEDVNRFIRE